MTAIKTTDRNPHLFWLAWAAPLMIGIGLLMVATGGSSSRYATGLSDTQSTGLTIMIIGLGLGAVWLLGAAICWQIAWHAQTIKSARDSDS